MAEKGGESGGGGRGLKGEVGRKRGGISVRITADREPQYATPRSPSAIAQPRRASRTPPRASPPRRSRPSPQRTPATAPPRTSGGTDTDCSQNGRSVPDRSRKRQGTAALDHVYPSTSGRTGSSKNRRSVKDYSKNMRIDNLDHSRTPSLAPRRLSFEEEEQCGVSPENINREVGVSKNDVPARDMMVGVDLERQTILPKIFGSSEVKQLLHSIEKISESTSNGKNDKDFPTRMKTSLEASKGRRKLSMEGPKNPGALIWQNGESSSQPVLGTLSVDLEHQIIFPKKGGSIEVKQLQNSVERISESTSDDKKDQDCPTRMCLSFEEEKQCYASPEKTIREVDVPRNGVSARDIEVKHLLNSIEKISESTSNAKKDKDFPIRMKTSLEASKGCRKLSMEGQWPKNAGLSVLTWNIKSSFPKKVDPLRCSTCLDHTIFICPCEIPDSKKLTDASISVTQNKIIPGGNKEVNLMLTKARSTLDGMVKTLTGSHKRNMCFDGDFSLANFCRTRTGDIKLIGLVPRPFTANGSKLDRNKMAYIIEQEFFAEADVPIPICELLDLMKNGVYKEEDLMGDHISMKPELERLAVYQMMYRIVKKLKKTDNKGAYKDILDIVKSHSCWHDWCEKAQANIHLKKIWDFINPGTQKPTEYHPTAESLLHYLDNGIKHLPDHSYDEVSRTTLFYDFEIDHILTGTFGAVLEVLQRAMFRSGKMISWV
ncbi:hypothetical protein VPH35_079145 [Triticum aestivum]